VERVAEEAALGLDSRVRRVGLRLQKTEVSQGHFVGLFACVNLLSGGAVRRKRRVGHDEKKKKIWSEKSKNESK
jgi:hypothetical protein